MTDALHVRFTHSETTVRMRDGFVAVRRPWGWVDPKRARFPVRRSRVARSFDEFYQMTLKKIRRGLRVAYQPRGKTRSRKRGAKRLL